VGPSRQHRVLEVIGVSVPDPAEVDPCVRELVGEEDRVPRDILQTVVADPGAPPGFPRGVGQGVGRGGHRQQAQDHELAVVVPTGSDEAGLGGPTHREGIAPGQHPRPVHPSVEMLGQVHDVPVSGEVMSAGQHAGQQQGRVDRGQFAVSPALPGLHVDEVIEESVFVGHVPGQEAQRGANPSLDLRPGGVAALVGDAQCGQAEAGGGDAGHATLLQACGPGPVPDLPGSGTGLLPEEQEGGPLDLVEQGFI